MSIKVVASMIAVPILCFAAFLSAADEPNDDPEPHKAVTPEVAAPPKAETAAPGKEVAESPPKKTEKMILNTEVDHDVLVDTQANRLIWKRQRIESRLMTIDRQHAERSQQQAERYLQVFEDGEKKHTNGAEREAYYDQICASLDINCERRDQK